MDQDTNLSAGANSVGSAAGTITDGAVPGAPATAEDLAALRAALSSDTDGLLGELAKTDRRVSVLEDAGKISAERLADLERDRDNRAAQSAVAASAGGDFPAREFLSDLLNTLSPYFRSETAALRDKYLTPRTDPDAPKL